MALPHLTCEIVRRFPIGVVRLSGELSGASAGPARAILMDALVEEPTSVVVELAGVAAADGPGVSVFQEVAEFAVQWPGAQLRLCGAGAPVMEALQAAEVTGPVAVDDSCREAMAAAASAPVPLRVQQYLEPTPHAPRTGRNLVAFAWREWRLPGTPTPAQVIASELVSNAVRHARTTVGFAISAVDGVLRLSAVDGDPQPVRLVAEEAGPEVAGRGLLVVDSLASRWGSVPLDRGKVVWAAMEIPKVADHTGFSPPGVW